MKTKRIFNQLLKPYKAIIKDITGNYTDIKITLGKSFCCYCRDVKNLEIEIPIFEDTLGHQAFYEKMQKRLQEYKVQGQYSSEILSFLHEIGHIYTYNKMNDFIYCKATKLIQLIQKTFIFRNSLKLTNLCYKWYFNLALEKNADKWAMKYIKEHQKQVEQWQVMLTKNYQKTIPKFLATVDLEVA